EGGLERRGGGDAKVTRATAAPAGRHQPHQHDHRGCPDPHGRSTITEVAFTVATALTPAASPSSSTESRVTAAVTRNGPASTSTRAITPSTSTEVTTPGNRLRADRVWPVLCRRGLG